MQRILRSGLGLRFSGGVILAAVCTALERMGWSAQSTLLVVVAGSLGLAMLWQAFTQRPPRLAADRKARATGAGE